MDAKVFNFNSSDINEPLEYFNENNRLEEKRTNEVGQSFYSKRSLISAIIDYGLTFFTLPIILPIIGILWIAVKISEPKASVFFTQTRYGLFGKSFRICKFRTMVTDAERLKASLSDLSEDKGPGFKIDSDPRVTRIGKILRKSYLDELPQLLNVLKGEMALVGPRANSFSLENYELWQLRRLEVLPGITGSWQIAKDKPKDFKTRCEMDIEYIENRSSFGDLVIIFKTALVCLKGSGS